MRKIFKGEEPAEWIEHRCTPGADYEAIEPLRQALLADQGYICAYCMRRIPAHDKVGGCFVPETTRIEHIKSRELYPDLKLDYSNMVICCPGCIAGSYDEMSTHCDRSKGNKDITLDLFSDGLFETISYTSDGSLKSSNLKYQKEIDDVLHLNNKLLKNNRATVKNAIIQKINSAGTWTKSNLEKLIREWDSKDSYGAFKPYNGIVLYYLRKKLRRM